MVRRSGEGRESPKMMRAYLIRCLTNQLLRRLEWNPKQADRAATRKMVEERKTGSSLVVRPQVGCWVKAKCTARTDDFSE